MFRHIAVRIHYEPAVFIDFIAIALFRDFIKRQAAGIRTEERTGNPADEDEADHDHSGNLETNRLHEDWNQEAPDSSGETRDEEREALCRCTIADWEELGAPELVELLLHQIGRASCRERV